jgi:hypothetical protein
VKRIGFVLLLAACACKNGRGGGNGRGTGTGPPPGGGECGALQAHVEELYRAEALAAEEGTAPATGTAERDEAIADNVTMVMNDCAAQPAKVAPCVKEATSVAELEDRCLIPLDEEGSEGDGLP